MAFMMVMVGMMPVSAAIRTSKPAGGSWGTAGTWVEGVVPTNLDDVTIVSGTAAVSLSGTSNCKTLTINSGGSLNLVTRTLNVAGLVINGGTITGTSGTIVQSVNADFTNTGIINISSNGTALTFRGSFINTGTLTLVSKPITFTGNNSAASTSSPFTTSGTITCSRTAGSVTLLGNSSGGALTISGSGGTLNLGTGLTHAFSGAITLSAGTLNGGSSTMNVNRVSTTQNAWTNTAGVFVPSTGTVAFSGGGTQRLNGTLFTTFNNLTLKTSGAKTMLKVPIINGILSMEGTATISASPTLGAASTIQYKRSSSTTMGLEFPNTFSGSGGVIIDQPGYTLTVNANKTALNGNLSILSGSLALSTFTMNSASIGVTLSIASGATLRIGGTNTLPSGYTTHSINAGSTIDYYGSIQSIVALNSTQNYGHLILSNSGAKTLPNSEIGIAGNLTISGSATVNPGTGTVRLLGTTQTVSGTALFNNLTIANSGIKTLSTSQTVNGILSMEGTATVSAAPTFGAASTIQYLGTGRTIGTEFPTGFDGTGGVIINPGIGNTITLNADKTGLLGNLNIQSGMLDLGIYTMNRASPGGALTMAASTTMRIGGSNSLPSDYATHSFDITSTILFNGSSAQSIGGSSSTVFGNLTLDNSNGTTLDFNQTVNGALTLSNGLLNTGTNTITIGCSGSIVNASASRYVNGKLALQFCSTGSRVFPIGKNGNYRPLTLNYTALTGTSTVSAEQIESTIPGIIPNDITPFTNRHWVLSQTGGSGYSFNLTLDGTDWSPTSYLKMLKGDGSTNAHHGVTAPNYTNSTAFTSFGNFGLGQLSYVTWLGTTSDWFSGSNWTSESPPSSTDEIHIPFPSTFYPSISGTSPGNDVEVASTGIMQIEAGATLTLENGPLLTFLSGATVTTGVGSRIVQKSGARYLNLSTSTPILEVQRELTDSKGWRMVSAPVTSTFSDMFKTPLVTQGFTGSSFPGLQPNLLWWLESDGGTSLQSWRMPSNMTDNLTAGRGYFHYVFNGAGRLNLDGTASGSNYTDVLPSTMSVTGLDNYNGSGTFDFNLTYTTKATSQTPSVGNDSTYFDLNALDQGWNLIGNPTASTLDWDAVGWTKTNMDNTIYVWDPSALSGNGDYLTWNGTTGSLGSGRIAPFQAFWAHATAATTLSFNNASKTGTSGTFLRSAETDATVSLPITLTVGDLQTTSYLSFSENGITGPDNWDGYRLEPMSDNWLELYTNSSPLYVSPLVINHLPLLNDELATVPLYCNANLMGSNSETNYSLSWTLPANWPSDWKISLQDHQTEQSISMKDHSSYSYHAAITNKSAVVQNAIHLPQKPLRSSSELSLLRSATLPPFSIIVSKGSDIEYMAPKPQLIGNFPNPFGKTTSIRFSLPQKARTSVEVYSAQGRKIAVLAKGDYPAGITEVPWDATSNAPGLYFIRFSSGEVVETKKAILIH